MVNGETPLWSKAKDFGPFPNPSLPLGRPDRTTKIKSLIGKRLMGESATMFVNEIGLSYGLFPYLFPPVFSFYRIDSPDFTRYVIADVLSTKINYRTGEQKFTIFEVKSCKEDYLTDNKWEKYLPWCNQFYFAVDEDFPIDIIDVNKPQVGVAVINENGYTIKRRSKPTDLVHPIQANNIMLLMARKLFYSRGTNE